MVKQIYEQVYDYIEADVHQRAPGEPLPSEMQYSLQLAVSRLTVRKAVDELVRQGLVTRVAGKGLFVSRTPGLAPRGRLLISCICMPGDSDLFRSVLGCMDAASRYHYDYKLLNFPTAAEQYRAVLAEDLRAYDGAVITCFDSEAEQCTRNLIQRAGLPLCILGNEHEGLPSVMSDDYNGGYLIGDDLAKHGHRDILFLTTDRPVADVQRRLSGFFQALRDNGIEPKEELVLSVPDPGVPLFIGAGSLRDLPFSAEKYLEGKVHYTAVTGYSTLPIVSFCRQLSLRGVRIPEDVSVVGYGDQPYLPWCNLPLTGIREAKYKMGEEAVTQMHLFLSGIQSTIQSRIVPVRYAHHHSISTIEEC